MLKFSLEHSLAKGDAEVFGAFLSKVCGLWSASFPKMIKYFVKKKKKLNNERYRDLLISILSYDEVSAFLLQVKTRN